MLDSPLHETVILRYSVDIIDKPFRHFTKTVMVSFYDESMKKLQEAKFGYLSNAEIFAMIDEGKDINLSNAYVKEFSLTDYRVEKGFDDSVFIKLNNFNAKKAFFDCDLKTDFSYAEFVGPKTIYEACIFSNGTADFNNANFGDGAVVFKSAKFGSGYINFQFATFGQGDLSFNKVCFGNGNASFVSTNFHHGNVDFKNTIWGDGGIDFKFAKFSDGDISFEKATFGKGKKDFKNLEFGGGKIDFRRVDFNDGDVSFEGVEFGNGKVSFRSSTFGTGKITFEMADFGQGEVQFDQVDFGDGHISFEGVKGDVFSFKNCPLNGYMNLRFSQCNVIDMSNTLVRDILDLLPEDEKVHIKEFNITGMRILGRIFIDWKANDVYDLIYNQKETSIAQKSIQFRILKENFRNNGQYDDEDASYIEFRRCEARANLKEAIDKNKKNGFYAYPVYYFQKYCFDFIGHYGTNPIRVMLNMGLAIFTYGFFYFIITEYFPHFGTVATTLPEEFLHLHEFWNSIYYSAITFFTIGYGDYFAEGYLKLFAALEGFTGVFLMSYFTVAFVRKILR
jgi:hypothetical protein